MFGVRGAARELLRCMRLYTKVDGETVPGGVLMYPPGTDSPTVFYTIKEAAAAIDRTVAFGTRRGYPGWTHEHYSIVDVEIGKVPKPKQRLRKWG